MILHLLRDPVVYLRRDVSHGFAEVLELLRTKPSLEHGETSDLILEDTSEIGRTKLHSTISSFLDDAKHRRRQFSKSFVQRRGFALVTRW